MKLLIQILLVRANDISLNLHLYCLCVRAILWWIRLMGIDEFHMELIAWQGRTLISVSCYILYRYSFMLCWTTKFSEI